MDLGHETSLFYFIFYFLFVVDYMISEGCHIPNPGHMPSIYKSVYSITNGRPLPHWQWKLNLNT